MKFPALSIDQKEYEQKLYDTIQSHNCVVFLDTNILSFLYKINESARKEFYKWIQEIKDRCFIPKWNAHEYMKRVIANQDDEYLGEIKKVSEAVKSFRDNMKYVRMYIDDNVLKGYSYSSADEYIKELESTEKSLQKLANAIKPQDTIKIVREEIQTNFEDKILETDIYAIVQNINDQGQSRYHCNLPPGFKDAKKEFNSYGDLVMWQEILGYCKEKGKQQCILVSRDAKKDFVYNVNIGNNSYKLTDERLKDEFKVNTGSDQFFVIDIERLISILSQKMPTSFEALAKAIQIIDISKGMQKNNSNSNDVSQYMQQSLETNVKQENGDNNSEIKSTSNDTFLDKSKDYTSTESINVSENALNDSNFVTDSDEDIITIITCLKSHNWPRQNDAIAKLDSVLKSLNESTLDQDKLDALFVLGRNIYQAACGNSFSAIQYLQRINENLSRFNNKIRNYVVCGALFEIFFNSKNEIRKIYKYRHSLSVLNLDQVEYKQAFLFIENKLCSYKDTNIVYTKYKKQDIVFHVSFNKNNDDGFLEKNNIYEIKINDDTINIEESFIPTTIQKSSFISELAQMYCLPKDKVNIKYTPHIEDDLLFTIDGNLTNVLKKST